MAVPIRVLWYLSISLLEKISIGVIFAVGIITMITAIIRSVSLESSTSGGQVSTTWLMLVRIAPTYSSSRATSTDMFAQWAGIEGAVGKEISAFIYLQQHINPR
jgi:hypothetical protein